MSISYPTYHTHLYAIIQLKCQLNIQPRKWLKYVILILYFIDMLRFIHSKEIKCTFLLTYKVYVYLHIKTNHIVYTYSKIFLFKTNKHVCLYSNYRLHHIHLENLRDGPYEDSPTDLIRW
jgi:hypothetical protein